MKDSTGRILVFQILNMRLESGVMSDGAWEYLVHHKFGTVSPSSHSFGWSKEAFTFSVFHQWMFQVFFLKYWHNGYWLKLSKIWKTEDLQIHKILKDTLLHPTDSYWAKGLKLLGEVIHKTVKLCFDWYGRKEKRNTMQLNRPRLCIDWGGRGHGRPFQDVSYFPL